MSALENTATDLFYKVRSRFSGLKLGNELGEVTINPEEARFFDFNFMEGEKALGHISISLAEQGSMKVYFSNGITEGMADSQKSNWYKFLKELRQFAKRRMLSFDTRDITKDNLAQRDYEFLSQYANKNTIGESKMNESSLYGTKNQSFQKLSDTRLVIKHSKKLTDEQIENPAARTRNISALFIENQDGERFKYPYKHLAGARAMQRHVANGGVPYDAIGESIIGISDEISQLKKFSNYVTRNGLMNEQTQNIVEKGAAQLNKLKEQIKKLSKQKNYEAYIESFEKKEDIDLPESTRQELKNKFTVYSFQEELENVFPVLYRLMQEDETIGYDDIVAMTTENTEDTSEDTVKEDPLSSFENWALMLGEESAITSNDEEEQKVAIDNLQDLVAETFPAGVDGTNAIESLQGIIDDPSLFAEIKKISKEDPQECVRPLVKDWLEANAPDVVDKLDFGDMVEEADDEPPFEPDDETTDKDEFGNPIKKKNLAKHLAKKGMKKAMDKDTIKEVADFVMSHYDREQGTFPKGPTAVAQSVEKKFGEIAGMAAQKMVERMAPTQDGDVFEDDLDENMNAILANAGKEKHGKKYMDAAREKAQEKGRKLTADERDKLRDKHSDNRKDEDICSECGNPSWTTLGLTEEQIEEGERHGNSKIYDKCWKGYRKVPGKKAGEPGSCKKIKDDIDHDLLDITKLAGL